MLTVMFYSFRTLIMRRALTYPLIALFMFMSFISLQAQRNEKGVQVITNESARRVDIRIDGKPFTSYIWPETLKKPVLYPLLTANGTHVTRGYPMDARPGERVDHPHHVGLWFNHGDVNGVDFWNNSTTVPVEQQNKMGTIIHKRIVKAQSGKDKGELSVEMDWIMPDGKTILREATTFVFYAEKDMRAVDRITTLTAMDQRVNFGDSKEGVYGLRVRRELEQPSDRAEIFTDSSGRPTQVAKLDNTGVTGQYLSSEGKVGDAVWGTRAHWTILKGKVGQEAITLAMLDNPKNVGFPTYWHARGYGLFAANPLGQEALSGGKEKLHFKLEPKQTVTFRYRLLILSETISHEKMETHYKRFIHESK